MTKTVATDLIQALADDPDPGRRDAAQAAASVLEVACDIAKAWGGDANALLRAYIFRNAVINPNPVGQQRLDLALRLDELCRRLGVPLAGPVESGEDEC